MDILLHVEKHIYYGDSLLFKSNIRTQDLINYPMHKWHKETRVLTHGIITAVLKERDRSLRDTNYATPKNVSLLVLEILVKDID